MGKTESRPVLTPNQLAKFVKFDNCSRYYKFSIENSGYDQLNHSKRSYRETFLGGNVIEKKAGNEFETELVNDLSEHVSHFVNLETITLQQAAHGIPDLTKSYLVEDRIEFQQDNASIETNSFDYCGQPATSINLADEDNLNDLNFSQDTESDNPLYPLRIKYTQKILREILSQLQTGSSPFTNLTIPGEPSNSNGDQNSRSETSKPNLNHYTESLSKTNPIIVYQPAFRTSLGNWYVAGEADFLFIWPPTADYPTKTRIIDAKLAKEEQTNHQIQTATYSIAIADIDNLPPTTIETGVLTSKDEFLPPTPTNLPEFDWKSRETDIKRLTNRGGPLDKIHQTEFRNVNFQLNSKCSSCQYNEACYSNAIENNSIQLLGIDRSSQTILKEIANITTIEDLVSLAETPDEPSSDKFSDVDPRRNKQEKPEPINREQYERLAKVPGLGEKLPQLIQQAQAFLGVFNPDHPQAHHTLNAPYLSNVGSGELPDDDILLFNSDGYKEGSLIRVYLNVQYDHISDQISAVAVHVTATASNNNPDPISLVIPTIPSTESERKLYESELLSNLTDVIYSLIKTVEHGIDFSNAENQSNPFIHFYTYTQFEKTLFQERLNKYSQNVPVPDGDTLPPTNKANPTTGNQTIPPNDNCDILSISRQIDKHELPDHLTTKRERIELLRDLTTGNDHKNRKMFNAIQPDIKSRFAIKTPTKGLINIYNQFYPSNDQDSINNNEFWEYDADIRPDYDQADESIDLQNVFNYRFFNNKVPYVEGQNSITLLLGDTDSDSIDGMYASRVRSGAQIPLGYAWSVTKKLDDEWVSEAKEDHPKTIIEPYRFHDTENKRKRITITDLHELLKRLAKTACHIESGIDIKNPITITGDYNE